MDEEIRIIVRRIQEWIVANPNATFIDPESLVGVLRIDPADLGRALMALVGQGLLRVRYRAVSPYTHALSEKDFDSPLEVDEELYDTSEQLFRREDAEIVPVFVGTPGESPR
jgi:hypothetical protein